MRLSLILVCLISLLVIFFPAHTSAQTSATWWPVQSIDTMKMSRDSARAHLNDVEFASQIDIQIKHIADVGATHVSIDTPYDEEFFPYLKTWVDTARRYNLKVWFRGNWAGWEGWFNYQRIGRDEHLQKTVNFINLHHDIFQSGDIFTACPECENGGPGDPRKNNDVVGHRQFLLTEYQAITTTFSKYHLQVAANYVSANADVARLVMDKDTTTALGGIVVIDHYVATPKQLSTDIKDIADQTGGKIVLGEFGAPIPDINGNMTGDSQAEWIDEALSELTELPQLVGVNYWVNTGGSTEIWNEKNQPLPAVAVIAKYFHPEVYSGWVKNTLGIPLGNATVIYRNHTYNTDMRGTFNLPVVAPPQQITVSAPGYNSQGVLLASSQEIVTVTLFKTHPGIFYKIAEFFVRIINKLLNL
jgi:hypothetical protein